MTSYNAKLLQELKSRLNRTTNWHKYQSKVTAQTRREYLDWSDFQEVNRLFAFSFEDNPVRTGQTGYFFPKVGENNYNIMIDWGNFLINQLKMIMITIIIIFNKEKWWFWKK